MSTTRPVVGYVNYLRRSTTVLASGDVAAGSALANLVDPNLTAVTNFGVGASKQMTVTFRDANGNALAVQPTMLFVRFRGSGYKDLTGLQLELSTVSDFASTTKNTTFSPYFPSPWPDELPVRPVVVAVWDAVTAGAYARLTWARTVGADPLELAYVYLGESVELTGGAGYRAYGSSVGVQDHSEETLTALQSDAEVAGAIRRHAKVKVSAKSESHVDAEWYPKFMYSSPRAVVYWAKPTSVDPLVIQSQVLLGKAIVGQTLDIQTEYFNSFEQEFIVRERL